MRAVSKLQRPVLHTPHLNLVASLTLLTTAAILPVYAQTQAQIRRAAEKALQPIERSIQGYLKQRACFSCHHNGLGLVTLQEAKSRGLAVQSQVIGDLSKKTFRTLTGDHALTAAIEGTDLSDPTPNDSLLLIAAKEADLNEDVIRVHTLRLARWQQTDGHWATSDFRPPHSSSIFATTETAVEALSGYAPDEVFHRAQQWFLKNEPNSTEDAAFKLLGLARTSASPEQIALAAAQLTARQLPNGGWPQLPGYPADAYSTGEAVYALAQVSAKQTQQRAGLRFLLATQAADGTWRTRTRMVSPARVSPPYFKTGFPYGKDEFLSFAGSAWALRALLDALPKLPPERRIIYDPPPPPPSAWSVALRFSENILGQQLDRNRTDVNEKVGDGVTLLMLGAHDEAKVRLLLSRGADAKARSKSGTDALTIASGYRNNAGALAALLDAGAEPNLPDDSKLPNSPLVLASMTGDLEMVKLLLARGADPNLSSRSNSPLSAAITFGHADVVKALIDAGAVTSLVDGTGINLLHWATITNRPTVIPLLAKAGVDINGMDDNGFTPLHYAASIDFGDTLTLDALLAAGADPKQRDYEERTPLQQAIHLGHTRLAKALQKGRRR